MAQKRTFFQGRTLVFSNRPPTAGSSGGAQGVIEAVSPTWWIGPDAVNNEVWNTKRVARRSALKNQRSWWQRNIVDRVRLLLRTDITTEEKANYDVLTFPAPKALEKKQYETIANEILWPVGHSIKPTLASDVYYEDIEEAYFNGYTRFNELGANATRKMVDTHKLTSADRIWVHDYQCENVPGMIYTRHCPFAPIEFLNEVEFTKRDGSKIPLLQTNFFHDLMELSANRALMTFHRVDDQINYIMALAAVASSAGDVQIESGNPALQNLVEDVRDPEKWGDIRAALKQEIALGGTSRIQAFGGRVTLMNIPIGQEPEETKGSASVNVRRLNKTQFKPLEGSENDYQIFHAPLADGSTVNLTTRKPEDFVEQRPVLEDLLEPIEGRNWVLSVHRNDYTKGTLAKLEAADKLFTEHPERKEDTTFLFVLQPTRETIGAYQDYANKVFAKAQELRERHGKKSVIIIPEAVKYDDILGMMRRDEVKAFMGLGHKDGHDLTVRECIDANDDGKALGIIASEGIGAADVVEKGDNGEDAAFIIRNMGRLDDEAAQGRVAEKVKDALAFILDPENEEAVKQRFRVTKARSAKFSASHFVEEVDKAYPQAMQYRFGEQWRQNFRQPLGEYMEHRQYIPTESYAENRPRKDDANPAAELVGHRSFLGLIQHTPKIDRVLEKGKRPIDAATSATYTQQDALWQDLVAHQARRGTVNARGA